MKKTAHFSIETIPLIVNILSWCFFLQLSIDLSFHQVPVACLPPSSNSSKLSIVGKTLRHLLCCPQH